MPLASRRSRHPLASKLVPSFLVVSFAVRLSSVSGGLIGRGGGGWNFHSKGGGGVHSRLEGRSPTVKKPLLNTDALVSGSNGGLLHGRRDWRGGGKKGAPPARKEPVAADRDVRARPGTMESEQLLAGNIQRLQFLRARGGIDLGATVFCLYAMAMRHVVATLGQPLRAARDRKADLLAAAAAERAASALGVGVGVGLMGPAAEAATRDALEPMPFPYMPSVGALLLALIAVVTHALLLLGKRWSVRFHAWSSFEEVLTWEEADAVLVTPVRHTGTPAICPLSGTPRALREKEKARQEEEEKEEEEEEDEEEEEEEEEEGGMGEEEEEEEGGIREEEKEEEEGEEDGSDEGDIIGETHNVSRAGHHLSSLSGDVSSSEGHLSFKEQSSGGEEEEGQEEEKEEGKGGDSVSSGTDGQPDVANEGAVEGPSFIYQRRKFEMKAAGATTVAAAGGPEEGHGSDEEEVQETFGLVELPVGWPLGRYLEAEGLTLEGVSEKLRLFGENSVDVKPPTFWHHLGERLTNPFVVFSLFNQVLWMLELYWLKAVIAIFEVVAFEAAFVADAERRRRELDIRNAKGPKKRIRAWRAGTWVAIPVEEMLPGDLVSVRAGAATRPTPSADTDVKTDKKKLKEERELEEEMAFTVGELPADVLLLKGTAVVNEASLTGESVPQIKTSLTSEPIDFEDDLDMTGTHSGHVLLSGTTLLDQTDGGHGEPQRSTGSSSTAVGASSLPGSTPDGGALCYVLRTGAYSFQGDLRRMIDFGSHGIREDSKDAAYLLLFLLSFAALSSFHVVREGLKSKQVSSFRLLVQCVRILSAVVPNDLSFELNQCLRSGVLSLQKGHALACTEPFRIPLAGNVDVCLFDKTGTITSDRLIAETLVTPQPLHLNDPPVTVKLGRTTRGGGSGAASGSAGETVEGASMELAAKVVVGGCHSLMNLDGVLHGDPLEASALEGIRWHWNATSHTARPLHSSSDGLRETPISNHDKADSPPPASSSPSKSHPKALSNKTVEASEAAEKSEEAHGEEAAVEGLIDEDGGVDGAIKGVAGGVEDATGVAVAVWRRYAFSSQLQRMSVVAEVSGTGLTADLDAPEAWVLCKGSPEAILPLLDKSSLPTWYEAEYARLATAGRRVVALAHRSLGASEAKGVKEDAMLLSRSEAEKEGSLTFDGFLSFHCKTRSDSRKVIRDLREVADCSVTIVTGDSVLTACHVAREVGLIDEIDDAGVALSSLGKGKNKGSVGKSKKSRASKSTIKAITKSAPASEASGQGRKTALLLTATESEGKLRWVPLLPPTPTPEKGDAATSSGQASGAAATSKKRKSDISIDGETSDGFAGGGNGRQGDDKGFEFSWAGVEDLAKTHDLCATGPAFELALGAGDPEIGSAVRHFRVLARMTPGLKEELATLLIESGKTVLMCGDGSNDVGALRRSHVGLALLSGFGDANTDIGDGKTPTPLATKTPLVPSSTAKSETASRKSVSVGDGAAGDADSGGARGLKGKSAAEVRREAQNKIQADITEEFERLRSEGTNPATAMWKASLVAQKKKNAAVDGSALTTGAQGAFAASAMAMFKDDQEGEGQLGADGVVRTGDASLAAPFTSKKPSIAAVVDVVRQGRCTMAAVLHTYQMVALHALFSSYTSSVLYLMRVRWPQRPLIVTSLMFQPLHLALASPRTTEDMSPLRPPRSVFHRSTFVSLLGQAALHVACMVLVVKVAQVHSPEINQARPASKAGLLGRKFVPSLVSNVVFLLATIQSVSVTVVNFKGRPFMRGILESPAIFLPAVSIVVFCFALTFEIVPSANKVLELAVFPSVAAKVPVVLSMIVSLVGPLVLDRLCVMLFDPELHRARKAEPPLGMVAKGNLALLGGLMAVAAVVVARTDFDSLEDAFGVAEAA